MASAPDHHTQGASPTTTDTTAHQEISDALSILGTIPRKWAALMVVLALLTSLQITRGVDGAYSVSGVSFGALALVSLALIWLPPFVRLLLLTGGSLKAAGVEASATGLLGREDLIHLLTQAKAVTALREDDENAKVVKAEFEATIDRLAVDVFDNSDSLSDDVLSGLAMSYERLRRESVPGPQRTSAMTRIVNEARVRAASSPDVAKSKVLGLLGSRAQGDRIVGLALAQESAPVEAFAKILRLVTGSATAFEMFHALLALQELGPWLADPQRDEAIVALTRELQDPRGVGVLQDPGLPTLIRRTIDDLRA